LRIGAPIALALRADTVFVYGQAYLGHAFAVEGVAYRCGSTKTH
jgi:hypothetical protein